MHRKAEGGIRRLFWFFDVLYENVVDEYTHYIETRRLWEVILVLFTKDVWGLIFLGVF